MQADVSVLTTLVYICNNNYNDYNSYNNDDCYYYYCLVE